MYAFIYAGGVLRYFQTDPRLHKQQEMSNNTVQCNGTQSQYRSTGLVLSIIGILGIIICGLILAFLLLILKKKAWESPVKRLGLALTISITLSSLTSSLIFALIYIFTPLAISWCAVNVFFASYWDMSILLYFSAVLVALLLQASVPIIPERWKDTQRYKPKAKYIEIILHISIFILTLIISSVTVSTVRNCCYGCCVTTVLFAVIACALLVLSALILVFTILVFGFFFLKFRTRVITTTTKWAVLKLSFVFMAVVIYTLYLIVPTRIEQKLKYHDIFFIDIISDPTMEELVLLLPLIMVIYLPSTLCCKCHKRTPDHSPLLPNTEMQHTNPPSEWDHSNVPSITVSVHPNEMSDCETDHVPSLTVPGPKYGATT